MTIKQGMKDGILIALGYHSVSFTFGLMAVAGGLKVWQAVLISAANLTSAGQLAGLDIMLASGSMAEMALAQFIINLRYSLMSIAVSQKADESMTVPARLGIGFGITDEIFALAVGQHETLGRRYMTGLIITPFIGWTLGTLMGAVLGSILPSFVVDALGIALYAMFLAIIIPPVRVDIKVAAVILISAALSCIRYYTPLKGVISSGFTIIIASIAASTVGALLFSKENK